MILKSSIVILFIILTIISKKDENESNKINKIIQSTNVKNSNNLYPMVKKLNKDYYNIIIPNGISFQKVKDLEAAISTGIKRKVLIENKDFKYSLTFPKDKILEEMYPIELIKHSDKELKFPIGYDTYLNLIWLNLSKNPNMLVSGLTNTGKSLFIHNLILQTLNSYDIEFTLADMKSGIELYDYRNLECVRKFTYDPDDVVPTLQEVERDIFTRLNKIRSKGCRNQLEYNQKYKNKMKYHIVIIEELMTLCKDKDVMKLLKKCLSVCRATGTYFVLTSQRFDATVIDGAVKANNDIKISFRVANQIDSRVILDENGAELLQAKGRCLYNNYGEVKEIQCFYVDTNEIENMISKYPTKQVQIEQVPVKSTTRKLKTINKQDSSDSEMIEKGWFC